MTSNSKQQPDDASQPLPHHKRIKDLPFRRAVDLLDAGNIEELCLHLKEYPGVLTQQVHFADDNYFSEPTLLQFVAENPIRHNTLPANIVEVTRSLLEWGASQNRHSVDMTLSLVCSGNVARIQGVQTQLIDVLCDFGADPTGGMMPALSHGELEAAEKLIERGAKLNLVSAAAIGKAELVQQFLDDASSEHKHQAFAMAAQHGRNEALKILLDAGEDPSRFNPAGFHAHSTPLHQAAFAGHEQTVVLLLDHGADPNIEDAIFHGKPSGWAKHSGQTEIAKLLTSRETN